MKTVYRVLAYVIAALVAVQAAAIGYAVFAQLHWIEEGGTLDEASFESAPGFGAYIFHALNGGTVLLTALALLIVSFFAKIPHGVRWADAQSSRSPWAPCRASSRRSAPCMARSHSSYSELP
jgi:hypothetical protein